MGCRPVSIDHVNLYVRNAERSARWYADVLGLHTQDTMTAPETGRVRAVFLSADPDHAHDVALFDVGDEAPGPEKGQVGDHTVSIGVYFSDPDGNGLEVYYELPRSQWHRERPFSGEGQKGRFPGPWDEALRQSAASAAP